MNSEGNRLTLISAIITIVALIGIIAHIMMPTMMIDNITLGLLVITVLPWFVPVIKSIKWGNLEVNLQDRVENLEVATKEMHSEMEKMAQTLNNMMEDVTTKTKPLPKTVTITPTSTFVHIANAHNTQRNHTIIDNPLTNNNPTAILMVTPNWNPPNHEGGVYNRHPIGVWYTKVGKWSIFNQVEQGQQAEDISISMPHGAAFNVQVLSQGGE
jgi:hypothetical protein